MKTMDHPNVSASVRYPVSSTKVSNSELVTQQRSIQYSSSSNSRIGPSPSLAQHSGPSEPIRNEPEGTRAMFLVEAFSEQDFVFA